MLTVSRHQSETGLTVELSGAIEENVNFEKHIGPFEGELMVKCRGITRINSVGVKTWMRYFQSLKQKGKSFKFIECPQPLVEQLNMILNFACGGKVESILLPFSCVKCQSEFVANCKTDDLRASHLAVPNAKCEKVDCQALFDDEPDDYFYFLQD